jgi:hypothetical protein
VIRSCLGYLDNVPMTSIYMPEVAKAVDRNVSQCLKSHYASVSLDQRWYLLLERSRQKNGK